MKRSLWKTLYRTCLAALLVLTVYAAVPATAKEVSAASYGFKTVGKKSYFYDENGKKHKGWLVYNGKRYYFNKKTGVQLKGWQYDGKKKKIRYFTKDTGYMVTGWKKDGKGRKRYFDEKTGKMAVGWQKDTSGRYRYFQKSTGYMLTGTKKIGKYYYRFDKNGFRFQDGFLTISKKSYYFDKKTGRAKKGWQNIDGKRYYFNSKYVMQTGLQYLKGYYYYFSKKNGSMCQKGFTKIGKKSFYFDKKTGRAKTGWLKEGGKRYYFSSKGVMYVSRTAKIGKKTYTFDANGVASVQNSVVTGSGVKVYDQKNGRYYTMAKEYATHPGIADGKVSDRDLLAAICDAEANDQGVIGMGAVAMCILNRTIKADKEFPSSVRHVVYQTIPSSGYPQYSPVRDGALLRRLNGRFEEKAKAYKAADAALKMFREYVTKKTPRYIKQFKRKDFNFMYFMTPASFKSQALNFSKVDSFTYKGHTFFVDWV